MTVNCKLFSEKKHHFRCVTSSEFAFLARNKRAIPANISCFPRRLQRNTFRLPRCLQDVFQDVFKTSSRRVCKTSCNYVFKTSSRHLGRLKNVTLQKSSVCLHQDECLLGCHCFLERWLFLPNRDFTCSKSTI